MPHTQGPWELVELDPPLDDWTGARYVLRQPKHAPGGIAVIMGGLGEQEERDNAHLVKAAPKLLRVLRDVELLIRVNASMTDRSPIHEAVKDAIEEAEAQQ